MNLTDSRWMDQLLQLWLFPVARRYDKEGHSMEGQSLTELRGPGGGFNTNWKTLSDVKTEHLGHGDKVRSFDAALWR